MKIGEKIRAAREELGLSQDEISRMIPMNQSSYSKLERDLQEPSLDQLASICRILHLSADALLSLRDVPLSKRDTQLLSGLKKLISEYNDA